MEKWWTSFAWISQGTEQQQREREAGVKALCSMLAATTPTEHVKQGVAERNGVVAFGRIRERFGRTAEVAKLRDVFQFQWKSNENLEEKWMKLMMRRSR